MRYFLFLLFLLFFFTTSAQQKIILKGNKFYSQGDYNNAIINYEKSNVGEINIELKKKIINCYRLTNQLLKAEQYLSDVCTVTKEEVYCNYYLNILLQKKDFEKIKLLAEQGVLKVDYPQLKNKINALSNDTSYFKIDLVKINSEFADMGIVQYKNGFVFCSSRPTNAVIERKHTWTNQSFLKLFYCENTNNNWSEPTLFSSEITSKYNLGPLCFSNKGKEIWVTENYSGKGQTSSEKKYKLRIVHYKMIDSKWTIQKNFLLNNIDYNVAHPAVSEDGNTIYFSSDQPGGYGGMDIYVSQRTKKGWSTPINLGPQINTIGNEVFPTLLTDGTIYFSSEGLIGLGGLDLFFTKCVNDNYLIPVNVGAPLNSSADDFHLTFDNKNKCGYLTSNRTTLGFNDNLYRFTTLEKIEAKLLDNVVLASEKNDSIGIKRKIILVEKTEKTPLVGIKITDDKNSIISISDSNGIAYIDSSYTKIKTYKDGFYVKEIVFNEFSNDNKIELKRNGGVANGAWYKIIYYDLDKSDIRKDMSQEMKDAVTFLVANPELKITITSFTDSRASETYNEKLSKRRTTSIEQYLLQHGIPKKQIIKSAWMGEGILVNNCGDALPCTEAMHQLNRRTEIFVSGLIKP